MAAITSASLRSPSKTAIARSPRLASERVQPSERSPVSAIFKNSRVGGQNKRQRLGLSIPPSSLEWIESKGALRSAKKPISISLTEKTTFLPPISAGKRFTTGRKKHEQYPPCPWRRTDLGDQRLAFRRD